MFTHISNTSLHSIDAKIVIFHITLFQYALFFVLMSCCSTNFCSDVWRENWSENYGTQIKKAHTRSSRHQTQHLTFGSFQMNRMLIKTIIDIHFQAKITSFSMAAIEYILYCPNERRKCLPDHFFSSLPYFLLPTKWPIHKIHIVLQMVQYKISFVNFFVCLYVYFCFHHLMCKWTRLSENWQNNELFMAT